MVWIPPPLCWTFISGARSENGPVVVRSRISLSYLRECTSSFRRLAYTEGSGGIEISDFNFLAQDPKMAQSLFALLLRDTVTGT